MPAPAERPLSPWPWPPALQASVGLHAAAGIATLWEPGAWAWALGSVAINHVGLTAAGLWPRSTLLGPNVRVLPAAAVERREFVLTLDDGPDPEVTPAVLDVLDAAGAQASFFVIARRAAQHAGLVREIVRRGHDVQNHSLHHRHDFSMRGPQALARDIGSAQALLADLTGQAPHCFRAPAGLRNPLLDPVLHRLGLHLVSWTRRGFDTRDGDPARVLERLTGPQTRALAAGDILLLHDGHARRSASGQPVLLEVLPALLSATRDAGLRTTTLRAALPARTPP